GGRVDVSHSCGYARVPLADQAVHLVRDGAVGRVALAPGPQLDELHGLAGVEVEDVADAEPEAQRVGRLALAALGREELPLRARDLVRAAHRVGAARRRDLLGDPGAEVR